MLSVKQNALAPSSFLRKDVTHQPRHFLNTVSSIKPVLFTSFLPLSFSIQVTQHLLLCFLFFIKKIYWGLNMCQAMQRLETEQRMKAIGKTKNPHIFSLFSHPPTRFSQECTLLESDPQSLALCFCKTFLSHIKLMFIFSCANFQKFIPDVLNFSKLFHVLP